MAKKKGGAQKASSLTAGNETDVTMESASDFLNDTTHAEQLTATIQKEISLYVDLFLKAKEKLAAAEVKMNEAQAEFDKLRLDVLPSILGKAGFTELRLDGGQILSIKEDIKISIPKEDLIKRQACFEILREWGYADNIKQEIVIAESDDQKVDQNLLDMLTEAGISYDRTEDVHSSTLKSIFKELLGMKKGSSARLSFSDVPQTFGFFHYKEATIKQ